MPGSATLSELQLESQLLVVLAEIVQARARHCDPKSWLIVQHVGPGSIGSHFG